MLSFRLTLWMMGLALSICLVQCTAARAHDYSHGDKVVCEHGAKCHRGGGVFGWRNYSKEERRNFPTCYGGYERYYGGFHANYYRDYPVSNSGLNNERYGWGSGWAW